MRFLTLSAFVTLYVTATAFSLKSRHHGRHNPVKVSMTLKDKFLPALIGGVLLFSNPHNSEAIPSGSRSGGSSFRSQSSSTSLNSYSTRSYSPSRSYSSSPSITIMPSYSPFGYGGFGFSPFGFMSFMPINLNVILLAGIAYAVYSVMTRGIGGSDFSSDDGSTGVLGSGASIIKLSIAMDSDWQKRNNIMEQLSKLAASSGSMAGRNDLSVLLSEASLSLLRHQNEWVATSYDSADFSQRDFNKVEPVFQQIAVKERTKFESEVTPTPVPRETRPDNSVPTVAVVSLVVAMRGKSSAMMKSVRSAADLKTCLQSLAADALTDEGENVLAVELLWTPSEMGQTLSQRDLIVDYPELIRL